jgi:hypothetical protein
MDDVDPMLLDKSPHSRCHRKLSLELGHAPSESTERGRQSLTPNEYAPHAGQAAGEDEPRAMLCERARQLRLAADVSDQPYLMACSCELAKETYRNERFAADDFGCIVRGDDDPHQRRSSWNSRIPWVSQ